MATNGSASAVSFDNEHLVQQDDQADSRSMSKIIDEPNDEAGNKDIGFRSRKNLANDIFNKVDLIDKMS